MNQIIDNIMADIKPDTHCWDDDTGKDVWSYSEGLVRAAIAAALVPKPKKYLHEYTSAPHPGDFGIAQEHWQWASDYHEAMKRWEYTAAQPHPKQEPVAWVLEWSYNGDCVGRRLYDDETHCKFDAGQDGGICRPLIYGDTAPQPQPDWVGLTSDERYGLALQFFKDTWLLRVAEGLSEAIEAKLREKNGGGV